MAFAACRRIPPNVNAALRRSFATAPGKQFVPPSSREDVVHSRQRQLPIPKSPTFYTGRSEYYDYISTLERAVHHTRAHLKSLHLTPLPDFARQSLPPLAPVWKSKEDLSTTMSAKLSATRHRRLLELLNQLNDFRRIAQTAGFAQLGFGIGEILEIFERDDKEEHLRRGQRKPVKIDEYGRSYTLGKRKTSSARVWMISTEHANRAKQTGGSEGAVPMTEILVNNTPLNEYFPIPIDRERILRPFRLTGLLGAYNVFALVRGGGTSGQSGAIAHGIAKGLAAHVPDIDIILRRGGFNLFISSHEQKLTLFQPNCFVVILVWLNARRLVWPRLGRG